MHPQIKIIGELPDGTLRAIAVNEDGSIPTTGGSGGSGAGGDASAANQLISISNLTEINDEIGNKSDVIANVDFLVGGEDSPGAEYSIFSLLKRLVYESQTYKRNKSFANDISGVIETDNLSKIICGSGNIHYLFIQNLVIPGIPTGELWLNFEYPATVGAGSIQIQPGESFEFSSSLAPMIYSSINLLGTVELQVYTAKVIVGG